MAEDQCWFHTNTFEVKNLKVFRPFCKTYEVEIFQKGSQVGCFHLELGLPQIVAEFIEYVHNHLFTVKLPQVLPDLTHEHLFRGSNNWQWNPLEGLRTKILQPRTKFNLSWLKAAPIPQRQHVWLPSVLPQ